MMERGKESLKRVKTSSAATEREAAVTDFISEKPTETYL